MPKKKKQVLDESAAPRKHSWQPVDATTFKVRGPNYLQDRIKYESMPAMFECVKGDIFKVDEKVPFLANHPQGFRNRSTKLFFDVYSFYVFFFLVLSFKIVY